MSRDSRPPSVIWPSGRDAYGHQWVEGRVMAVVVRAFSPRSRLLLVRGAMLALLCLITLVEPAASEHRAASRQEKISAAEFARMVRDFSEDGGYFRSDNFTSNETSYLHVVSKLRQLAPAGGAYVGVGPEQNFTYIAKIRPRVAFIVDIRRQAIIQHLMFKAIFQVSTSRAQYLSLLLSRPIPRGKIPAPGAPIADIVGLINKLSPDDHAYARNLARIRRIIQHDFQVDLSSSDQASLEYVYRSFRLEGLDIAYRVEGMRG